MNTARKSHASHRAAQRKTTAASPNVDPHAPWLVVGLGNPEPQYENTRHNVGYLVIDEVASRHILTPAFSAHKRTNANIAETFLSIGGENKKTILAKPRTYMNESGGPVKALAEFFKVPAQHLIVVHDELELDPGHVTTRLGGGDKGHNGLKSISKAIGTKDYQRVNCGIGRPPGRMAPASYVLKPFPKAQAADVAIMCADAADAIERLMAD